MELKRIGVDTSKAVLAVHGIDAHERAVLRRISHPCRGIEAPFRTGRRAVQVSGCHARLIPVIHMCLARVNRQAAAQFRETARALVSYDNAVWWSEENGYLSWSVAHPR